MQVDRDVDGDDDDDDDDDHCGDDGCGYDREVKVQTQSSLC